MIKSDKLRSSGRTCKQVEEIGFHSHMNEYQEIKDKVLTQFDVSLSTEQARQLIATNNRNELLWTDENIYSSGKHKIDIKMRLFEGEKQ